MKTDIKIKYNDTFGTVHSRDYYKGKSFHYAGEWTAGAHYFSDDYNVDFIVKDNCLLACSQSHYATVDNEPKDFIYDDHGIVTNIASRYWDFVLTGIKGNTPQLKIENDQWWVSYDDGNTWISLGAVDARWENEEETSIDLVLSTRKKLLKNTAINNSKRKVQPISASELDDLLYEFGYESGS